LSARLESLLDPVRRAECEAADREHEFGRGPSGAGYLPHGGYHWPQVRDRSAPATERRSGPRASRFGDLTR